MPLKKHFLFFAFLFFATETFAQSTAKKSVPPFDIELTNSKHLQPSGLQKNVPLMLVYFSPTCEYCKEFTKNFLAHINELGNIQIVMITYLPIKDVAAFENEFSLSKYSNVIAGSEGYAFTVQKFYGIKTFPFTALFNSKSVLNIFFRTVPAIDLLIEKVKKL